TSFSRDWSSDVCSSDLSVMLVISNDAALILACLSLALLCDGVECFVHNMAAKGVQLASPKPRRLTHHPECLWRGDPLARRSGAGDAEGEVVFGKKREGLGAASCGFIGAWSPIGEKRPRERVAPVVWLLGYLEGPAENVLQHHVVE